MMKKIRLAYVIACTILLFSLTAEAQRKVQDFDAGWSFFLGDTANVQTVGFDDSKWRKLNLPHDWSIEGTFSKDNPAMPEGGALPGGISWYRKSFTVPDASRNSNIYIDFDGVYQRSDVWINGHHLGFRPNGYISFRYELTPYLKFNGQKNIIAVKVDNSLQPNSRYYSGSGIYRNVWLVTTNKIAVDHWGTFVTTPSVSSKQGTVNVETKLRNATGKPAKVIITTKIYDPSGKPIQGNQSALIGLSGEYATAHASLNVANPILWSVDKPALYKVVTEVLVNKVVTDRYETPLGFRYFNFDAEKGFSLNGERMKIRGVCMHHDLGALGAAINTRALQRQLEILKGMGVNGIRTSHNPPAPELLDLCDKMGFIVMDEAFDMWEKAKQPYDYHLFFKEWHTRDLQAQILRDRNHPSVFMWSIGNEIKEQADSTGYRIASDLAATIRALDKTRPITSANNDPTEKNQIVKSGSVDVVGYNYHIKDLPDALSTFPGKKLIGSETTSAIETRGVYDMPSDSIRRWAGKRSKAPMNADFTVSAYDNVSVPWGSTHEETWKVYKKYDFLSGMFIWTGFDYLGEPTPYSWPARSSYFGIVDLAGFPKDVYYMYQSEWTNTPVLHILPHWNWEPGKLIDVWAYYNNADEVELFLNGKSLGTKKKEGDDLHVMWRMNYEPGALKAVSRKNGKVVLTKEVKTAGTPVRIVLQADRSSIKADGKDLSFVTVKILDKDGNLVPNADNLVSFKLNGQAFIAGVDNGDPISHDPFKASYRKAFHGLALAIIQSKTTPGTISLTATSPGLQSASVTIKSN
jgi:beta-galactosidase